MYRDRRQVGSLSPIDQWLVCPEPLGRRAVLERRLEALLVCQYASLSDHDAIVDAESVNNVTCSPHVRSEMSRAPLVSCENTTSSFLRHYAHHFL